VERTLFAKLVATLDESLTLPIPQRFLREAWLPGAQAAWHQGLCTERESLLALVLTPMPGHGVERLIGAAVELALLDSKHFSERFDSGALGGRLADLARAEVASRVAACLASALNVVDTDAFEGDSGVVPISRHTRRRRARPRRAAAGKLVGRTGSRPDGAGRPR